VCVRGMKQPSAKLAAIYGVAFIHDIVIANIVSCIAYQPEVERGKPYTVQQSLKSIAPGWSMQVVGGGERMVDSCITVHNSLEV